MSVDLTDLSQEIINLVASYLQRWEHEDERFSPQTGRALLPTYATISQSWQHAIEYRTFRKLSIKSTEIEDFSRIMVKHRRRQLRRLEFNVVLPTYPDLACAKFETEIDKQANNKTLTKAIKDLLALLRSWHDELQATGDDSNAPIEPSLLLCIVDCYSPMDGGYRGWEKYQEHRRQREDNRRHDLFEHRYESSLLQLDSAEGIQKIPQISCFLVSSGSRSIEPRSLAMIASKFPNLDNIRWRLNDKEKRDPRLRQQTRFSGSLFHLLSVTVTATWVLADRAYRYSQTSLKPYQ